MSRLFDGPTTGVTFIEFGGRRETAKIGIQGVHAMTFFPGIREGQRDRVVVDCEDGTSRLIYDLDEVCANDPRTK